MGNNFKILTITLLLKRQQPYSISTFNNINSRPLSDHQVHSIPSIVYEDGEFKLTQPHVHMLGVCKNNARSGCATILLSYSPNRNGPALDPAAT